MALVTLLRGVNVGGHRAFRPSVLARQLARYGVTNIGVPVTNRNWNTIKVVIKVLLGSV